MAAVQEAAAAALAVPSSSVSTRLRFAKAPWHLAGLVRVQPPRSRCRLCSARIRDVFVACVAGGDKTASNSKCGVPGGVGGLGRITIQQLQGTSAFPVLVNQPITADGSGESEIA